MSKKELKHVAKRVTKKVLSKAPFKETFEGLLGIDAKLNVINDRDFEDSNISAITSKDCTATEVRQIRDAIIKRLKKEFGKKHSYFVTTKIMLALWALAEEIKETDLRTKRERFCYWYVERYDIIIEDFEEALQNISLLD